jgi:hypothetical protein
VIPYIGELAATLVPQSDWLPGWVFDVVNGVLIWMVP